jgi:hypothetical protein
VVLLAALGFVAARIWSVQWAFPVGLLAGLLIAPKVPVGPSKKE